MRKKLLQLVSAAVFACLLYVPSPVEDEPVRLDLADWPGDIGPKSMA